MQAFADPGYDVSFRPSHILHNMAEGGALLFVCLAILAMRRWEYPQSGCRVDVHSAVTSRCWTKPMASAVNTAVYAAAERRKGARSSSIMGLLARIPMQSSE